MAPLSFTGSVTWPLPGALGASEASVTVSSSSWMGASPGSAPE
jgi:hypothetical protein